ncbi:MAG: HIT family protein [Candidatus Rokubacteria bacterium]|nr:HIT family protein [Candidatus Rokubacteria bacterium]
MSAPACTFCAGAAPAADHRIADLGVTAAYLNDDQYFPGWVVLFLKRHATELFELEAEERRQMMDDVTRVAAALYALFSPRKINYAFLGNQLPHIHWHVTPRLPDDPAPRDAIWAVPHAPVRLAPAERDARIAHVRAKLASG